MSNQVRLARALDHHRAGRLEQADALYAAILRDQPRHADALHLAGVAAHQRGQHERAIDLIGRAIAVRDTAADYHNNMGEAFRASGDMAAAKRHYQAALERDHGHADAHNNLGLVLLSEDSLPAAVNCFQAALALEPRHARAHNNLGIVRKQQARFDEAIDHYRQAIAAAPAYAEAHANLANALYAAGEHDAARASYQRALALDPDNPDALVSFGTVLKDSGEMEQAGALYRKAVSAAPNHADANYNLAVYLQDVGAVEEAIFHYRRAIALAPERVDANKNLSVALMLNGEFAEGFERWAWRWREPGVWSRALDVPVWRGEPLAGKTLLVWGEQGVGDEVMLATILPEVIADAGRVIVECDSRLVGLFARSMPGAEFVPRLDPPGEALSDPTVDFACPIGDLCRWLRATPAAFDAPAAYLQPDPARLDATVGRYRERGPDPKIGIAWRSTPRRTNAENLAFKSNKSSPLDVWGPVLRRDNIQFVNLQYGDCAAELASFKDMFGADIHHDPSVDQFRSLEDFAAQIAALDLIISTSNTTVHLAGAMGKPVWTLIHAVPDWRWQRERTDTLWYPNMRLFRQPTPGDWNSVFNNVGAALDSWLERHPTK